MDLNNEEKEILNAYDRGDYVSMPNARKVASTYREYAKSTLKKNKRINIRLSERDLMHLQRIAVSEGLPYQTLITSIIHKYINGG